MHAAHCKWKKNNNNSHFTHVHILNYMHIQARQSASWLPMRKLSEREREGKISMCNRCIIKVFERLILFSSSFLFLKYIRLLTGVWNKYKIRRIWQWKKEKEMRISQILWRIKCLEFGSTHTLVSLLPKKALFTDRITIKYTHTHTQTHGRNIFAIKFQLYGISI